MKNQTFTQKIMKFLHKFGRFNTREKVFLVYLLLLTFFLLVLPIVKISSLKGSLGSYSMRIWKGEYLKTMLIVSVSILVLLLWNLSTRFKNMSLMYFGGKENSALINFLFLFIIASSLFAISDTVHVVSGITSRVTMTGGGKLIQVWVLIGIIMTLVSVIKNAKETGKKTQIINVVNDEHKQIETTKYEIKKGLFDK